MKRYLDGMFLARRIGFHFASPPPEAIHDRRFLLSHDEEEVLACILANLQRGAFDVAERIVPLLQSARTPGIWNACTTLIGYAAPLRLVRWLVDAYGNAAGDFIRHDALEAAAAAGSVWAVPQLLLAHANVSDADARRFFQHSLSFLLEDTYGAIAFGPDELPLDRNLPPIGEPEPELDLAGYARLVQAQVAETTPQHAPTDALCIAEGEPMNLSHVAKRLLDCIIAGEPAYRIEKGRMLFEAMTGIDCRTFYDSNGALKPLSAAAIVEDFIQSGEAQKYAPGLRYFFGHLIPS